MVRIKKYLKIPKVVRNIILVVLLLLTLDVLAIGLLTNILHGWFFGSSGMTILCDLLFFEGAIIFAIGAFLASGITWFLGVSRYPRGRYYVEEKMGNEIRQSSKKQLRTGIFMMILGAMLIGLSVAIGQLFL